MVTAISNFKGEIENFIEDYFTQYLADLVKKIERYDSRLAVKKIDIFNLEYWEKMGEF